MWNDSSQPCRFLCHGLMLGGLQDIDMLTPETKFENPALATTFRMLRVPAISAECAISIMAHSPSESLMVRRRLGRKKA